MEEGGGGAMHRQAPYKLLEHAHGAAVLVGMLRKDDQQSAVLGDAGRILLGWDELLGYHQSHGLPALAYVEERHRGLVELGHQLLHHLQMRATVCVGVGLEHCGPHASPPSPPIPLRVSCE